MSRTKSILVLSLLALSLPSIMLAKIQGKMVDYKSGNESFQGYLAWDDAITTKRPAILVVHDWLGVTEFVKGRADELAKLGYVAFAADIYGKGVRPKNPKEAMAQVMKYKANRALLRDRVNLAFRVLAAEPQTLQDQMAAIGYCFGGTTVLELARSGAPLKGVVSFHGGLDTPTPGDAKNIKGKVLALHGADDPHVSPTEVAAFEQEMRDAHVDWQLVAYGNAVHAFAVPSAGTDNSKGAAYNEKADRRSWQAMKDFLNELFSGSVSSSSSAGSATH